MSKDLWSDQLCSLLGIGMAQFNKVMASHIEDTARDLFCYRWLKDSNIFYYFLQNIRKRKNLLCLMCAHVRILKGSVTDSGSVIIGKIEFCRSTPCYKIERFPFLEFQILTNFGCFIYMCVFS